MTGNAAWAMAALLLAALGVTLWQNSGLRADVTALEKRNSEVAAANAAQKSAIDEITRMAAEHSAKVTRAEKEISEMAARNRNLENNLKKATSDAMYSVFQFGRDVSDSLCMRWLNAENRLPDSYATENPGSPAGGRDDPVAAFCAEWHPLTAEDAAIYIGDLIDHAGRVKARLRAAKE